MPQQLRAAHEGYRYQDLFTAYVLAQSLVQRSDSIVVDRKLFEGDIFDDLTIQKGDQIQRIQIKSSRDGSKELKIGRFTNKSGKLPINQLVDSYLKTQALDTKDVTCRLCTTRKRPSDDLAGFLHPVDAPSIIRQHVSKRLQFDHHAIWPEESGPKWSLLASGCTREEFAAFCQHFVIETEVPSFSSNLRDPGRLEAALIRLLTDRIGIGRYPNQNRDPVDVAALLIRVANRGRAHSSELTPDEIENALNLRADYGRVAQSFPLNENVFQNREAVRPALKDSALNGINTILTGPPGAGKSWELTRLAEDLRSAGAIVARHYCYLEPGDEEVEVRIKSNALFGNLVAELIDVAPSLQEAPRRRYAAGPTELEEILAEASELECPIVLIIDGLDHISRVRSTSPSVSEAETDIIDQIATLQIPPNVAIVLGSQPGDHLEPLRSSLSRLKEYTVPPWSNKEIRSLAKQLGLDRVFQEVGLSDTDATYDLLTDKTEGNPLYATYLSRGLRDALISGKTLNPNKWLRDLPIAGTNIEAYYAHLYEDATQTEQSIADVLGTIDFGVTEDELKEILPSLLADYVPEALKRLNPILRTVSSQGGIRIFHESFRRFMLNKLSEQGRSMGKVLAPVIDWLESQGFFQSAKAYRFLLPLLRRANRADDALNKVGPEFISTSLAHGHSKTAIERNLYTVLNTAVRENRWPAIVRVSELDRSLYACFEQRLSVDPLPYWKTYLDLRGPEQLSDRLLFDGKPTLGSWMGLVLCSIVDNSGVTAPWREYLDDYEGITDALSQDNQSDDSVAWLRRIERAAIQGRIRTEGFESVHHRILHFLIRAGRALASKTVRLLAQCVARSAGEGDVLTLLHEAESTLQPGGISSEVGTAIRIGLAQELARVGDHKRAADVASEAAEHVSNVQEAARCLQLGADPQLVCHYAQPLSKFDVTTSPAKQESVASWIASARILAHCDPEALEHERKLISGEGWYPCWLRYMLTIIEVEAAHRKDFDSPPSVLNAFEELNEDVRPFKGSPRACDLYSIRLEIADSLQSGFELLSGLEEWTQALNIVDEVIQETWVTLRGGYGGPTRPVNVLERLLPFATQESVSSVIADFANSVVESGNRRGTYFGAHADREMILARILQAASRAEDAEITWRRVTNYLVSYGFRKDPTIFELTDSISSLKTKGSDVREELSAVQPLTYAVLRHTDLRTTKHAPNRWFRALMECYPAEGLHLLAHSMSVRDAVPHWILETATSDALSATVDLAQPELTAAAYETLLFDTEYEGASKRRVDKQLQVIKQLLSKNRDAAARHFQILITQVLNDGSKQYPEVHSTLKSFADSHGLPITEALQSYDFSVEAGEDSTDEYHQTESKSGNDIYFPYNWSQVDVQRAIRDFASKQSSDRSWDRFINGLGYRLAEIGARDEDKAIQLVRFAFRQIPSPLSGMVHPFIRLAEGLERHELIRVATHAYVMSYVHTRGGRGWLSMGDKEHAYLMQKAVDLHKDVAHQSLGQEVEFLIHSGAGRSGLTRHLIGRIANWGNHSAARASWWQAYAVIKHRLPTEVDRVGGFERYNPSLAQGWNLNDALVALIISRIQHPVLGRKLAGLLAYHSILEVAPASAAIALSWFLGKDATNTSVHVVLHLLSLLGKKHRSVLKDAEEILTLYASSEQWGARKLAEKLLSEIGKSSDSSQSPLLPTVSHEILTAADIEKFLSVEPGKRIGAIDTFWPHFSDKVARRLKLLLDSSDIHRERMEERYKIEFGQQNRNSPTPVLNWESELAETAVHEMLNGLRAYLWKRGRWSTDVASKVLGMTMPNLHVHLGLQVCRTSRPGWGLPSDYLSKSNNLWTTETIPVIENGPQYARWKCLARCEVEWVQQNAFSSPSSRVHLWAGAFAVPSGRSLNRQDFPFRDGDPEIWWKKTEVDSSLDYSTVKGPIIGISHVSDYLGQSVLLLPPPQLKETCNLSSPSVGEPLAWLDENGKPAIVLRSWVVRSLDTHSSSEPVTNKGSDLLIRPDVYASLQGICNGGIKSVVAVKRVPLDER